MGGVRCSLLFIKLSDETKEATHLKSHLKKFLKGNNVETKQELTKNKGEGHEALIGQYKLK